MGKQLHVEWEEKNVLLEVLHRLQIRLIYNIYVSANLTLQASFVGLK